MINDTSFLKSSFYLPYNSHNKHYRVLWHQEKNIILKYCEPSKTMGNFDIDVLSKPLIINTKTLSSSVTTIHKEVFEDTVIEERWTSQPGGLSTKTMMFYELLKILRLPLGVGTFLIWYPKDKNDKRYVILPLAVFVGGDQENLIINPVSDKNQLDLQWLTEDVVFKFRIVRPFIPPDMVTFFTGI